MLWDTIVTVVAWAGLMLMLFNIVGTVWQLSEKKASVAQFWVRVGVFSIWLIVCGRVLGWW